MIHNSNTEDFAEKVVPWNVKATVLYIINNCLRLLLVKSSYNIHKTHRKVGIEEDSYISP